MEYKTIDVLNGDKTLKGDNRICIHERDNDIFRAKICIHNFRCRNCYFDQWFEDMFNTESGKDFSKPQKYLQN